LGILVAVLAFLPAAPIITLAEVRHQRSPAFYSVAGIVSAMLAWGTAPILGTMLFTESPTRATMTQTPLPEPLFSSQHVLILSLVAAGLMGGLVYRFIAGRTAGVWRVSQI
jgi:hypothetical protein